MPRCNEKLYLTDIRDAIDRILGYTSAGRTAFMNNSMVQDAVVRNLEILGEAVKGVAATTREAHTEIPGKKSRARETESSTDTFGSIWISYGISSRRSCRF